jgi:hypothetical protein
MEAHAYALQVIQKSMEFADNVQQDLSQTQIKQHVYATRDQFLI